MEVVHKNNSFSINTFMIGIRGNSMKPDTIDALRLVKDSILSFGSIYDISISKSLMDSKKKLDSSRTWTSKIK